MAAVPSGPSLDSTPHYTQIKKKLLARFISEGRLLQPPAEDSLCSGGDNGPICGSY
jgi:hypothetical protein